jgi:hypothetical protein
VEPSKARELKEPREEYVNLKRLVEVPPLDQVMLQVSFKTALTPVKKSEIDLESERFRAVIEECKRERERGDDKAGQNSSRTQ